MLSLRKLQIIFMVVSLLIVSVTASLIHARSDVLEQPSVTIARSIMADLWSGENLEHVADFYAQRFYTHSSDGRVRTQWTPSTWKTLMFESLHMQYPDLSINILTVVAEGDRAIVHFEASGHHTGEVTLDRSVSNQAGTYDFRNIKVIPATGAYDSWDGVIIFRFEDGQVVEEWWYWDAIPTTFPY